MPIYTVKFPDGHSIEFESPADLSDNDAWQRAVQERAINEGKIATTWWQGAAPPAAKALTQAALVGGGLASGQTHAIAAAPLAGRAAESAARKLTGLSADLPSPMETASLVGAGLLAYGPGIVSKGIGKAAEATTRIEGTGYGPWQVKEFGNVGRAAVEAYEKASPSKAVTSAVSAAKTGVADAQEYVLRTKLGVSADDLALLREHIKLGMKPTTAARIVGGRDPNKMASLLRLYAARKP